MDAPDMSDGQLPQDQLEQENVKLSMLRFQNGKELIAITAALLLAIFFGFCLWKLMCTLLALIEKAAYFHSAPILMVDLMDWHIILLATALVAAPTLIIVSLLRSVFPKSSGNDDLAGNGGVLGKLIDAAQGSNN